MDNLEKKDWLNKVLAEIKELNGLTQNEIAQKINISRSHLSSMKSGVSPVTSKVIIALCQTFDIPDPRNLDMRVKENRAVYGLKNEIVVLKQRIRDLESQISMMKEYIEILKQNLSKKNSE